VMLVLSLVELAYDLCFAYGYVCNLILPRGIRRLWYIILELYLLLVVVPLIRGLWDVVFSAPGSTS